MFQKSICWKGKCAVPLHEQQAPPYLNKVSQTAVITNQPVPSKRSSALQTEKGMGYFTSKSFGAGTPNLAASLAFKSVFVLLLLLTSQMSFAQFEAPDYNPKTWIVDGAVNAMVKSGNTVYIGGSFNYVGPNTGRAAPISINTGQILGELLTIDGAVNASLPDGDGGFYIGGAFTTIGGVTRIRLAHILADHTLDLNWTPDVNGNIFAMAISGGKLYVGGTFTEIGGQFRNNIAALDAASGTVLSWSPNANGEVSTLAVSGSTVYAGGFFTSIGGQSRNRLAALDTTTGAASPWNPDVNGNASVQAMAIDDSIIYVGGLFGSIGGESRNNVAAVNVNSGAVTSWNPNASNGVTCFAINGNTVYVGGVFTGIGGESRTGIVALDKITGAVSSWNPNASSAVRAIAINGNTIYLCGNFTSIGGEPRNRIAAVDATTALATSWDPNAQSIMNTLAISGNTVYAGGIGISIGGKTRSRIAAIDATTGTATSWNPGAQNTVSSLAISGNIIYAGGSFISIGGIARNRIAAIDATSGTVTSWNPNANGNVNALAISGNTVYAGGAFLTIGGQSRNRIAALDATTGAATSWNPNASSNVNTLAISGGTVYAGGTFTSIGGQTRSRIAALDATTGAATSWNPNASSTVNTLAINGSTVYAGGAFTSIGAQTRNRIAALDYLTGEATSWDPNANSSVFTIAISDSTVYAGGSFTDIGGLTRNRIVALNATTGNVTGWNPNFGSTVNSIVISGDTIFTGGNFTSTRGQVRFAALSRAITCTTPATPAISSSGATTFCTGDSVTLSAPAGFSYLWSTGETTQDIVVTTAGSYTVQTISASCTSAASAATVVTVNTPPSTPTITTSGPTTFTTGGSVTLTAPAGFNYIWSTNETTQNIVVTTSGSYTVRTISNGCTSEVSAATVVTVTPPLAAITIWNGTGNWSETGKWSNGVPTFSIDSVIIASGHVTLNTDVSIPSLNIASGATLEVAGTISNPQPLLQARKYLTVNGHLQAITAAFYFGEGVNILPQNHMAGSGSLNIGNMITFGDLFTYDPQLTVAGLSIFGTSGVGSFRANNPNTVTTFASSATTEPTMIGHYLGTDPEKFKVLRYIDPAIVGSNGAWFNIGPPIKNFSIAQFAVGNPFAANTFNNSVANGSSLYLYDPNDNTWPVNQGFVKAPGMSYTLTDPQGVRLWVSRARVNAGALEFKGLPFAYDTHTFPLAYCASGCNYGTSNGYNLVKNPLVAAVRSSGFTYNNADEATWVWSNTQANYASFVGGIGINNGRDEIAAGQAFWVRATSAGASLSISPSSIASQIGSMFPIKSNRVVNNVIRLKLMEGATMKDETAVRIEPTATAGHDAALDAMKFQPTGSSIYTLLSDGTAMGINSLPVTNTLRIPVALSNLGTTTSQQISVGLENLDAQYQVLLNHSSFSAPLPLQDGQVLNILPSWSTGLELIIQPRVTSLNTSLTPSLTLRPNPATTAVQLHLTAGSFKGVSIMDQLGRTVLTTTTLNGDLLDISTLAAGTYVVKVSTENGVATQRLAVVR